MNTTSEKRTDSTPSLWKTMLLAIIAVASFHLAYSFAACSVLMAVFLYCLFELSRVKSARVAFYCGLIIGLFAYGPQLYFFWNIFNFAAVALWAVLAFWLGLFLLLAQLCRKHFDSPSAALLIPFLWTGLEYFRSELYYLKFSWMNVGYSFAGNVPLALLKYPGMYGIGFLLMLTIALSSLAPARRRPLLQLGLLTLLAITINLPRKNNSPVASNQKNIHVAGVQLEFPTEQEAIFHLNQLIKKHPETDLLVLSEYTFNGPLPESIKIWCKAQQRYLIIGAKDPVSESHFNDTAFVVGPSGEVVFKQGKSVPIQFFKDGLPAKEQTLWHSPWGMIGICICYDLSYTRVTDQLVRLGAQAIIVPTMDLVDWGEHQHKLHTRVAPIRSAEYDLPIFRLASSGISQSVCRDGRVEATAPCPGQGTFLAGSLDMSRIGRLPLDRVIAPASVGITIIAIAGLGFAYFRRARNTSRT